MLMRRRLFYVLLAGVKKNNNKNIKVSRFHHSSAFLSNIKPGFFKSRVLGRLTETFILDLEAKVSGPDQTQVVFTNDKEFIFFFGNVKKVLKVFCIFWLTLAQALANASAALLRTSTTSLMTDSLVCVCFVLCLLRL